MAWHLKDQPSHAPQLVSALGGVLVSAVFVGIAFLTQPLWQQAEEPVVEQTAAQEAAVVAESGAQQPAVVEEPAATEPVVEPRATAHELLGDSSQMVQANNTYGILTQAIGAFEDKGYELAFVLHDLNSGHELTYNADTELYPASSIKGPYTASVYEMLVETGEISSESIYVTAEDTIHSSSDESYRRLLNRCGRTCFRNWLEGAGVGFGSYNSYEDMLQWNYPWMCATQLNQMWRRIYTYVSTVNSETSQELRGFLHDRDTSPMRDAIGASYETLGKAGWIDSEGEYHASPATVDSGIVFAGDHPYAVTVMSTAPADLESLSTLFAPLDRAHNDMVQGFAL